MIKRNYSTTLHNVSSPQNFIKNPHELIQRALLKAGYLVCRDRRGLLMIIPFAVKVASW